MAGDVVTAVTANVTSSPRSATSSTPSSTPCPAMRRRPAPTRPPRRQVGGWRGSRQMAPHGGILGGSHPTPTPPVLSRRHVGSAAGEGRRGGEALHLLQEQQALHHGDAHPRAGTCAVAAGWGGPPHRCAHRDPPAPPHSHRCRMATTLTPTSRPTCCPTPRKQPRGKPKWPEKPATPPTTRWCVGWRWGWGGPGGPGLRV